MTQPIETAVILAAGLGTRLQPYTFDIPKGFMQVGDEKLIERSVRVLRKNGIKNIFIGTGHLHEQYEQFARENELTTFLNPDYASTGSFHTLVCGKQLLNKDFLLLESDLLYHSSAIASLLSDQSKNTILCSGFTRSNDEVYVEVKDEKLRRLSKQKEELNSIDAELVGIWKISQSLYGELLKHHVNTLDSRTKDYEIAIAELSSSHDIHSLKLEHLTWCEIDNQQHLARAKEKILPKLD